MKKLTIQQTYHDALYWATSPKTRGEDYHLTRVIESILRKIIHYDGSMDYITFSNDVIANHVFLSAEQIKKGIPQLEKIGYINCTGYTSRDENGKIKSRRTIYLNWDFIEEVLSKSPKKVPSNSEKNEETLEAKLEPTVEKTIPKGSSEMIEIDGDKDILQSSKDIDRFVHQLDGTLPEFLKARVKMGEDKYSEGEVTYDEHTGKYIFKFVVMDRLNDAA